MNDRAATWLEDKTFPALRKITCAYLRYRTHDSTNCEERRRDKRRLHFDGLKHEQLWQKCVVAKELSFVDFRPWWNCSGRSEPSFSSSSKVEVKTSLTPNLSKRFQFIAFWKKDCGMSGEHDTQKRLEKPSVVELTSALSRDREHCCKINTFCSVGPSEND